MPLPRSPKTPAAITKTMIGLMILGYGLFLVTRSTYQNYTMNKQITTQKERVAELKQTITLLELSLYYYRSNSFKEIEARRRLHLKGVGEHVVALPHASTEPQLAVVTNVVQANQTDSVPPYAAWWQLFFGSR